MAEPSPADGVVQAVRRVRLAAGSLAGPLDAFTVVAAAAQALPAVLSPTLAKLTTSPYAGLAGLLGAAGVPSGAESPGRAAAGRAAVSAPRSAPAAAAPVGVATRATDAMAVLGRFVSDELNALAVKAAPAPAGTAASTRSDEAMRGPRKAPDPVVAGLVQPLNDFLTATGVQPAASQDRAGAVAAVVAGEAGLPAPAVEGARAVATTVSAGLQVLEELTGRTPPRPQAAATPGAGSGAASAAAGPFGALAGTVGELLRGVGAGPAEATTPHAKGSAHGIVAPTQPGRGAPATTIEEERRRLLDAVAAAEQPAAAAVTARAEPGAGGADDLAWLVNEALVEQARLHGVDLR